jgi:crotonobetainyl-CoA:carnitine CoA-transferase CaiB-like acyl-CoA transferase
VLDLSALWAGPLCGSLMQRAGADVVRVETAQRPDGGRAHPAFDDLLHGGQPSVVVDPATPDLRALVRQADVVITSGRPRALAGLGLDPAARLAERPGVWVSVTAYPDADRVGFGDDTAMAAGLVCHDAGVPLPCGDAIADPLTGVHAALAAWACVLAGGRHHVRLNLRDVAASTLLPAPAAAHPVAEPRARSPLGRARALGADTRDVLTAWGCR